MMMMKTKRPSRPHRRCLHRRSRDVCFNPVRHRWLPSWTMEDDQSPAMVSPWELSCRRGTAIQLMETNGGGVEAHSPPPPPPLLGQDPPPKCHCSQSSPTYVQSV
ncbi:uncharacterized protein ACO6RY_02620 [Pungitius sinensis]